MRNFVLLGNICVDLEEVIGVSIDNVLIEKQDKDEEKIFEKNRVLTLHTTSNKMQFTYSEKQFEELNKITSTLLSLLNVREFKLGEEKNGEKNE